MDAPLDNEISAALYTAYLEGGAQFIANLLTKTFMTSDYEKLDRTHALFTLLLKTTASNGEPDPVRSFLGTYLKDDKQSAAVTYPALGNVGLDPQFKDYQWNKREP